MTWRGWLAFLPWTRTASGLKGWCRPRLAPTASEKDCTRPSARGDCFQHEFCRDVSEHCVFSGDILVNVFSLRLLIRLFWFKGVLDGAWGRVYFLLFVVVAYFTTRRLYIFCTTGYYSSLDGRHWSLGVFGQQKASPGDDFSKRDYQNLLAINILEITITNPTHCILSLDELLTMSIIDFQCKLIDIVERKGLLSNWSVPEQA